MVGVNISNLSSLQESASDAVFAGIVFMQIVQWFGRSSYTHIHTGNSVNAALSIWVALNTKPAFDNIKI